ncbi:hypothetical protein B0T26DRAFT_186586 [Lasiosphaeria miniovina]|uniref:Uncharacterized protein n=1 Tax=Lasiosphaeria miniovina TaxID=1954250 RepID=A0AA40B731_9PEZI|nr:uncharacterized protein B0T26DRAFT_186586 [Lasiosphaeria miniovina]KAK0728865.1 hypothetical protein B0T26DRAFT_186586 [Lasiosphaeria miniovina]
MPSNARAVGRGTLPLRVGFATRLSATAEAAGPREARDVVPPQPPRYVPWYCEARDAVPPQPPRYVPWYCEARDAVPPRLPRCVPRVPVPRLPRATLRLLIVRRGGSTS